MKTRTAGTPKSAPSKKTPPARKFATDASVTSSQSKTESPAAKKTPPAKKSAVNAPLSSPEVRAESAVNAPLSSPEVRAESATPKSSETARISATKAKLVKGNDTGASSDTKTDPPGDLPKEAAAGGPVNSEGKAGPRTKTIVRKVIRRKVVKLISGNSKNEEAQAAKVEDPTTNVLVDEVGGNPNNEIQEAEEVSDSTKKETVKEIGGSTTKGERTPTTELCEHASAGLAAPSIKTGESTNKESLTRTTTVEEPVNKGQTTPTDVVAESMNMGQTAPSMNVRESGNSERPIAVKLEDSMGTAGHSVVAEGKVFKKEDSAVIKNGSEKEELEDKAANAEENVTNGLEGEDEKSEDEHSQGGRLEEHGASEVSLVAKGNPSEDDEVNCGDETMQLEEHMESTTHVNERSLRKDLEIFIGGLDRSVKEDDVRKAFEKVGEVVEVRLHNDISNVRAKGFAFLKFGNKEQANRALSEVKNPIICGKRCGTAPSEDNNTLFLGNICNTWTKEAIKQKIKDYGVEGVVNITLVADPRHEGKSRGFAFVEFLCHSDAMLAYKRLQKPDVLFGHAERTAKVAFAEPIREPDPEIMAQVKSVFVDGLPPHWDEDAVKNQFKVYGEIEKIVLGRNMSTAKRKDFGFVDFSSHEAAVACIDGIKKSELIDGNSKIKVKARLSNPLPKTQAVKGGMCGGFRIGHGGGTSFQYARGFGRSQPPNRENFQHGRGFHLYGQGQTDRMGFVGEQDFDHPYGDFHGRHFFEPAGRSVFAAPPRLDLSGPSHRVTGRGHGGHFSARRIPFSPDEGFVRPFVGRRFDDPYEDAPAGFKRPFYMTDPGYMEPSRLRPRLDHSGPAASLRETHYRDAFGMGAGMYDRERYGPDHDGSYSPFYGADRPFRGGYY